MDCSPPDSSVHGILQPRMLEWVAIPFSRGSSGTRDRTSVSCITGRFFTIWATGDCHFESSILWIHLTASLIGGSVTLVTGVDWSTNQEILILVLSVWPWAGNISSPSMFSWCFRFSSGQRGRSWRRGRELLLLWSCLSLSPRGSQSWLVPGTSSLWPSFAVRSPQFWEPLDFGTMHSLVWTLNSGWPWPSSSLPPNLLLSAKFPWGSCLSAAPAFHPFSAGTFPGAWSYLPAALLVPLVPGEPMSTGPSILDVQAVFSTALLTCQPRPWSLHTSSCWDHRTAAALCLLGVTWNIPGIWLGGTVMSVIM